MDFECISSIRVSVLNDMFLFSFRFYLLRFLIQSTTWMVFYNFVANDGFFKDFNKRFCIELDKIH